MFAIRLLQKAKNHHHNNNQQQNVQGSVAPADLDPHIAHHYGIPSTASILAFDPIQRLMAIGTLDGRIKVVGGDNVEGLLISPKQLPFKNLEFLHNQGFLVSVSNENDIQVWDLEHRQIADSLKWECNITAFSVIPGTHFMYIGDEYGMVSVLKYDAEEVAILQLPYHIPANSLADAAGVSLPDHISVVGVLPQPCTSGNRLMIAYENGLIVLWDVSESRVVLFRGHKDLQLKDDQVVEENTSELEQEEKEISSLCWASLDGSILAVGYVDGDIFLWNMLSVSSIKGPQAGGSSNDAVKLQSSSGKRKIPVIVLHWSANSRSNNERGGQLFIYGGDDIGSEEVLTASSLECSSGKEAIRCVNRVDLSLNGSFADMILVQNAGATENNTTGVSLFLLTNPGQLHVYDDVMLASLLSQQEKSPSVRPIPFPVVVPMAEPHMTVAKLCSVPMEGHSSKALLEASLNLKATLSAGTKWPLTGGISKKLPFSEDDGVEKVYIAGYKDGSIQLRNATYSVLSPIAALEGEVQKIEVSGASAPVSALDFCFLSTSLAVGSESGLVRIYRLGNSEETSFHFVSENNQEVHSLHQAKGLQCIAAFCILNSPIRTLQYADSGAKLAVGFECGQVAMFDMSSLSVLYLKECVSGSSSPVISTDVLACTDICSLLHSSKQKVPKSPKGASGAEQIENKDPLDGQVFILTRDSHVLVLDSVTGNTISSWGTQQKKGSTAISMYIIDNSSLASEASTTEHSESLSKDSATQSEQLSKDSTTLVGVNPQIEIRSSRESRSSGKRSLDSLVVLCCEDALHVYSLKSVIQGDNNSIRKVSLSKPCCWTTTFKTTNEKASGIILLYQTGMIEIRSFPDLKVVGESSLMSILRWSFKTNMERTVCSTERGQIAVVNGSELAFISFLASESDSRISDSLPCLHDKVLAAAADAAIRFSSSQKKKQGSPGILGIIKGFKGEKGQAMDSATSPSSDFRLHLESIFSSVPFSYAALDIPDFEDIEELNIDDIEIDEPVPVASTSSYKSKNDKGKDKDREKLFDGAPPEKPKLRTPAEIMIKYKYAGDASAAAAEAKDKLLERQEKLERIRRNTEELSNGAENFASMANELVKTMEGRRKWWNI
ncbi:uncharacterized protein LOC113338730 isoform X3 [Papaver somniferum]|uniref:uncharacterized protein LOC113338730 isoform X3 n=1 Tax=Papaver somniferum TaxID=3469 RepID=UPI000E6FFDFF|nr:uncharacterized protein LOC113338730 isoform X3 [Papaver somniferum]